MTVSLAAICLLAWKGACQHPHIQKVMGVLAACALSNMHP